MSGRKFLFFARSFSTIASPKCPTVTSSLPPLIRDYCRETNAQSSIYSHNRMIDCLIKSGSLHCALCVFDEMPVRDVVTWNLLISGHSHHGHPGQAICFYSNMIHEGIEESSWTFSTVLSVCCDAGFHKQGMQVHSRVVVHGLGLNAFISSSLVNLYMHMGLHNAAMKLFSGLPTRNLAVWNLVLRGFCSAGWSEELLGLFTKMKLEGVEPNALTFCYLLRGCSNGRLLDDGRKLHCLMIKIGWVESNTFAKNALVDFYSACGSVADTRKSFEAIPAVDVISWNSVVAVFAETGLLRDAILVYTRMQLWGKRPSIRSFLGFLNWCSGTKDLLLGEQIHCGIMKLGFDYASAHVQSSLINMYGKCGMIESSVSIFDSIPHRTLESCNSLMTSLFHNSSINDVVEMFSLMINEGIGLDEVSLSATLKSLSVSTFSNFSSCRLLHGCAIKMGFENDIVVSCSLIDAYSKSGQVDVACQVFENLQSPNLICFTSIINGYAWNGLGREGLKMLTTMTEQGMLPDEVTIFCVLIGCCHAGLVQEGRLVFDSMSTHYGIDPGRQHYSCMVDLLGRAGQLDEAEELLQQAPSKNDTVMWSSLLRSCRVHQNKIVGKRAAKILMELGPEDSAACLQASKFYSEIGDFEASIQARDIATEMKSRREVGCSHFEAGYL